MIREEVQVRRSGGPAFVFALDPGETTGYAWGAFTKKEVSSGVLGMVRSALSAGRMGWGQVPMVDRDRLALPLAECRTADQISELVDEFQIRCTDWGAKAPMIELVIEDFILRERTQRRDLLSPVRLTSAVVKAVDANKYVDVMLMPYQAPANAKTVIKDERLKRQGLWIKGQQHSRDALRHLLLHLRNRSA